MHTNEKRGKKKTQIWTQHARKPRESNDGEDWGTQKKLKLWERKQQNEPVLRQKSKLFQKTKHMKTTSIRIEAKIKAFFRKKTKMGGTTTEKAQEHKKI